LNALAAIPPARTIYFNQLVQLPRWGPGYPALPAPFRHGHTSARYWLRGRAQYHAVHLLRTRSCCSARCHMSRRSHIPCVSVTPAPRPSPASLAPVRQQHSTTGATHRRRCPASRILPETQRLISLALVRSAAATWRNTRDGPCYGYNRRTTSVVISQLGRHLHPALQPQRPPEAVGSQVQSQDPPAASREASRSRSSLFATFGETSSCFRRCSALVRAPIRPSDLPPERGSVPVA